MNVRGWFSSAMSNVGYAYNSVTSTIGAVVSHPSLGGYAKNFGVQFWEGFSRILDPNNLTKYVSAPDTSATMYESFKANASYLGFALLLEMTKQAILLRTISGNNTWVDTSIEFTLNLSVFTMTSVIALHRFYDNTLLNASLAKQATREVPLHSYYQSCECDGGALIKAGLMSPVNSTIKLLPIVIGSCLPIPGIKYITTPAYMYVYGEGLVDYAHAAAGTCTEHRAQKLAKENGYVFGTGASLYLAGESILFLLSQYTGAYNLFISNAIYSAIYPYFETAILFRDRSLPNEYPGVDFYRYHRNFLNFMASNMKGTILPLLQNKDKKRYWAEMAEYIADTSPGKMTKQLFSCDIYGDWRSPKNFVLSPVNKLFFKEYYKSIIREINKIIDLRDKPIYELELKDIPTAILGPIVPVLPNRLTGFFMSDSYKELVTVAFSDWMDDPLKAAKRFFDDVHQIQEKASIRVLSDQDPRWKKMVDNAAQIKSEQRPTIEEVKEPIQAPTNVENKAAISGVTQRGIFARPEPTQPDISRKHKFLLELKEGVNNHGWDTKGSTLFGTCVPDKIDNMRSHLKSLHMFSSPTAVNIAFDKVKGLFTNYRPIDSRNKDVEALYRLIVHNLGILVNNPDGELLSLSQSQTPQFKNSLTASRH